MRKLMIVGALTAFISSLILNLILPAICGFIFATLFSGLTLLDPLYAGDRTEAAWGIVKTVLLFQTLHTFITAPVAGSLIGYLHNHIKSRWLYVLGGLLTVGLHYLLTFIFVVLSSFMFLREYSKSAGSISILLATLIVPLIGLMSVYLVRRGAKQNSS